MIEKCCYEYIVDEIIEIIKTNIFIYYNRDDAFLNLKDFCREKDDNSYQNLDYWVLISFVEEALAELINCEYLYDFRTLE